MPYKLNRNTTPATNEAARVKRKKQDQVRENIRLQIFKVRCVCGKCKIGDYSNLCTSYGNIAKLANIQGLSTVTGNKGNWQTTQVARLFPNSRHKNYSLIESKQTPENQTSLDGLI